MKVRAHIVSAAVAPGIAILCAAVFVATTPSTARAGGVVGTGSAASCTDAALDAALAGGGLVTFNCGGPATIDLSTGTGTKMITVSTTIDGAGLTTISGGNAVRVFSVTSGAHFTVDNLMITNGFSDDAGGGIYNLDGTLTVTNSTFSGNRAARQGGAIFNAITGTVTVTNSTVSGNQSIDTSSVIAFLGQGGGIVNDGTLTITNSTVTGNGAIAGGGIVNDGTLTVTNSTVTGNGASGIFGEIPDPNSGPGGGILNAGTLTVTNSTFTGNTANYSSGGGIFSSGTLTVTNSTFTGNTLIFSSGSGAGIATDNGSRSLFRNSIVTNNTGGNCSGGITDGGHNLDDGTSCGFSTASGSLNNTDPLLDPAGLAKMAGLLRPSRLSPTARQSTLAMSPSALDRR